MVAVLCTVLAPITALYDNSGKDGIDICSLGCHDNAKPLDVVIMTDDEDLNHWNGMTEDGILMKELEALGRKVERKSFTDPEFDWSSTKVAILRSAWDRFDKYEQWEEFSTVLIPKSTILINSWKSVQWVDDKSIYMPQLAEKGIHIIDTVFVDSDFPRTLKEVRSEKGWDTFIMKPAVSNMGCSLYKVTPDNMEEMEGIFSGLLSEGEDMLVQVYEYNLVKDGEISVIAIGGDITHAMARKWPAGFPSHAKIGSDQVFSLHNLTQDEALFAENVINVVLKLGHVSFYTRIDICRDNSNNLAIIELAISSPELFLRYNPEAAALLAKQLDVFLDRCKCDDNDEL